MKRINRKGQGATEYITILAIVVGAIVLFSQFGGILSSKIQSIMSQVSSAGGGGNP